MSFSINLYADTTKIQEAKKACDNGNSTICFELASMYFDKFMYSDKREYEQAMFYSKQSCNLNNAQGCALLGIIHLTKSTYYEAIKAFDKACDGGLEQACKEAETLNTKIKAYSKPFKYSKSHYNSYLLGYKEMNGKKINEKNIGEIPEKCEEIIGNDTSIENFSCKLGAALALQQNSKLSYENFSKILKENLKEY